MVCFVVHAGREIEKTWEKHNSSIRKRGFAPHVGCFFIIRPKTRAHKISLIVAWNCLWYDTSSVQRPDLSISTDKLLPESWEQWDSTVASYLVPLEPFPFPVTSLKQRPCWMRDPHEQGKLLWAEGEGKSHAPNVQATSSPLNATQFRWQQQPWEIPNPQGRTTLNI